MKITASKVFFGNGSIFHRALIFMMKLAWQSRFRLPMFLTIYFAAMNYRLQREQDRDDQYSIFYWVFKLFHPWVEQAKRDWRCCEIWGTFIFDYVYNENFKNKICSKFWWILLHWLWTDVASKLRRLRKRAIILIIFVYRKMQERKLRLLYRGLFLRVVSYT